MATASPDFKNEKLINQRSDFDCVLACLSMFFGEKYDSILESFFKDYKFDIGIAGDDEKKVFKHFGARHIYFPTWYMPPKGVKAIIAAPSLNLPGKIHAIYYDGTGILDPQKGRKDRKFYEYNSSPDVNGLTLDINDIKALKVVSDSIWHLSFLMSESLKDSN